MPQKKPPDSGKRAAGDFSDPAAIKAALQELKELGQADRIELQTRIINGDLIPRTAVTLAIGRVFGVYRSRFLTLGETYSDTIGSILNIEENERHRIRSIMGDLEYVAMNEIKNNLETFIESH